MAEEPLIITVQRSDTSYCLPSLKRQIEEALHGIDPWQQDKVYVRVLLTAAITEEEATALYVVLQRLEGSAEGWRYLEETQGGVRTWEALAGGYEFTVAFRCMEFKDLVND